MNFPTPPSGPPGGQPPSADGPNGPIPSRPAPAPARGEPSRLRRDALKRHECPPIALSNLCPIDKYYAAAEKVYDQFKVHLANMELDDAYVIGRRFALFSTVSLPGHDYYASPRAELVRLRLKNQKDAHWVTRGLERIVEVMDKQEIDRRKAEEEKLRKRKEEEERKRLDWEKNMRQRLGEVEISGPGDFDSSDSALDMMSKLEKLNTLFPQSVDDALGATAVPSSLPLAPNGSTPETDALPPLPPPMAPPLIGEQDASLLESISATQQLKSNGLTPLLAEPDEPPSYSDLFLDTLRTPTPTVTPEELAELERLPSTPAASRPKPAPRTPIRVTQRNCLARLQHLKGSKQIEVIRLGTYQGRLGASNPRFDSTNGCAVISPLVVATHIYPQHINKKQPNKFSMSGNTSKYGISNSAISDIIDRRAPPILHTVRSKLGLNKHALIIPSDVHDYLVDEHILPQDKFVGVCGGALTSDAHVKELTNMLVTGRDDGGGGGGTKRGKTGAKRRVGAALFFREHVVSVVKVPLGNGTCYYDLIDSLPSAQAGGMASRTRCKDLSSFEALLRWYASSKFSESNCDFIDNNEWDDAMCDFDPRVFQGFVWAE